MAKYRVLSPLEHNGEPYQIDSEIELDDAFSKPLLDVGVIVKAGASQTSQNAPASGEAESLVEKAKKSVKKVFGA